MNCRQQLIILWYCRFWIISMPLFKKCGLELVDDSFDGVSWRRWRIVAVIVFWGWLALTPHHVGYDVNGDGEHYRAVLLR